MPTFALALLSERTGRFPDSAALRGYALSLSLCLVIYLFISIHDFAMLYVLRTTTILSMSTRVTLVTMQKWGK